MTAKYFAILTNYGAAQLANAVALGTQMNISKMAVGDGGGTLPVPDPAQTKLVRETRRAAVNQVSVDEKNPNFIIAEQVIPENEGGWFIREIGLFDDNGGLIAVGNAPETYKPNLQEGSGRTQVIQMVLMVSSTQAITLKVDPSVVLATREYVTKSVAAAIQESEAKAAKIYATKSELSSGLSGKQPTGDYATRTELNNGLSGKQPTGNYATKTEVNSKLAKDQNGADIQNKDAFVKNLGLGEGSALPVGVPVPWPLPNPPQGWLKYNGAPFDKNIYPKLGAIYPSGVLPDLRGEFIRGWDDGRGVDTNRALLSLQGDAIRNITGRFGQARVNSEINAIVDIVAVEGAFYGDRGVRNNISTSFSFENNRIIRQDVNFSADKVVPTANENRPRNIAFNYIVRAA